MKPIYLDHAATTYPYPFSSSIPYANPSSPHILGQSARTIIENSRDLITFFTSHSYTTHTTIFTSSGTEANNLILKQSWDHIITSPLEHPSVLAYLRTVQQHPTSCLQQAVRTLPLSPKPPTVHILPLTPEGTVSLSRLSSLLSFLHTSIHPNPHTPGRQGSRILVTIQAVNNEVGIIQPLQDISAITHQYPDTIFHTDAVQFANLISLSPADAVTLSAHKLHGPKGIGSLTIPKSLLSSLQPLIHGGGQEFTLRSSTEATPLIAHFAKATITQDAHQLSYSNHYSHLHSLLSHYPQHASSAPRAPHIINIATPHAEEIATQLSLHNICVSTHSACSTTPSNSGELSVSHVIQALSEAYTVHYHKPYPLPLSGIRVSFAPSTTVKEVKKFIKVFDKISSQYK